MKRLLKLDAIMSTGTTTPDRPKVYPPVGKCIYCGKSGGILGLSREHIVPFGLAGGLILPKASCASCRAMTGAFEETCLRVNFLNYRVHAGMPTRRPKERPKKLPLNVMEDGSRKTKMLSKEEHPHHLLLPEFLPPGILTNTHLPFDFVGTRMMVMYFDEWPEKVANLPYKEILPHNFSFEAFIRMLAKIAHGFAVAELGLGAFKPLLLDLIAWRDPALARYLVGGTDIRMPVAPSAATHFTWTVSQTHLFLQPTSNGCFIVVRIQLFPIYPTPAYAVVAGEATPQLLSRYGLVLAEPNPKEDLQVR